MKCTILGRNTSNLIASSSLRPVIKNFMTYPISPLSATLTQFETSVPLGDNMPNMGTGSVEPMEFQGDSGAYEFCYYFHSIIP